MKVDDLWNKTVKEVLEEYCILYSPECDYNYGICRWDDANAMYEEYDLEDQYCFSGDSLIPLDYGFDDGEEILEKEDLKCILSKLGMRLKESCPKCNSNNYHLNYNDMKMLCSDCGYKGKPKYGE